MKFTRRFVLLVAIAASANAVGTRILPAAGPATGTGGWILRDGDV